MLQENQKNYTLQENQKINFNEIYTNLDKMCEMKRYKAPTHGYFPTVAEINTYARSTKFEHIIPYLLWLDECLTPEQREEHKEALVVFKKIIASFDAVD